MKDIINILHVEDDKLVAASVSKTLAHYNQNIYTCYDGKEALDIIETQKNLEQKKLQIEHFKEAMSKSNLIINTLSDGTITNISFDSFSQLSDELSNNKLENISFLIDKKDLEEIHKIVNSYNVYNKTININFKNIIYIVNLTAFALEIEENQVNEISLLFKDITLLIQEK